MDSIICDTIKKFKLKTLCHRLRLLRELHRTGAAVKFILTRPYPEKSTAIFVWLFRKWTGIFMIYYLLLVFSGGMLYTWWTRQYEMRAE